MRKIVLILALALMIFGSAAGQALAIFFKDLNPCYVAGAGGVRTFLRLNVTPVGQLTTRKEVGRTTALEDAVPSQTVYSVHGKSVFRDEGFDPFSILFAEVGNGRCRKKNRGHHDPDTDRRSKGRRFSGGQLD